MAAVFIAGRKRTWQLRPCALAWQSAMAASRIKSSGSSPSLVAMPMLAVTDSGMSSKPSIWNGSLNASSNRSARSSGPLKETVHQPEWRIHPRSAFRSCRRLAARP